MMHRSLSFDSQFETDEKFLIISKRRHSNFSTLSSPQQYNRLSHESITNDSVESRASSVFSSYSAYAGLDTVPRFEHYSREDSHINIERPPLEVLHRPRKSIYKKWNEKIENNIVESNCADDYKFGWITGVFVPTFMNLLGAVVYLRMGWMAGQTGIVLSIAQIMIGTIILSITVLSMTAICTNGQIGTGGMYFMISRSLGPATGVMFAIMYFITNAIMVAFSIVGTCEGVQNILLVYDIGIVEKPSGDNDARIVGAVCLAIVAIIPFISLDLETKTQWLLFGVVIISLIDYIVGTFLPPNDYQKVHGFEGWKINIFMSNLWPKYDGQTFFTVFAVYASGIAGDFTGASMSGTLRDASTAIPKGSLYAILLSSIVYIFLIVFLGSTVVSYATGNIHDLPFNNYTCTSNVHGDCQSGLINDYDTMPLSSALTQTHIKVEPLIAAGLFAQTISSAMCSYIAAPQIFQALAYDNILPYLSWFAKGYGPLKEPRRGYIIVAIISLIFIGIADFNAIAAVISNCYLASWALINVSCFLADFVDAPNFRPTFKWFNKWISLICGLSCFALMFLFDWISAVSLISLMCVIWLYIYRMKPEVNWGTSTDANLFLIAHSSASKLNLTYDHVKNYRPSVLLLCGNPKQNLNLACIANEITKSSGMLIVADIRTSALTFNDRCDMIKQNMSFLHSNNIKCFYNLIEANSLTDGANMLIQCSGLGKLKPNILMMGYLSKWRKCSDKELADYYGIIHASLELHQSLVIYCDSKKKSEESHDSGIEIDNENLLLSLESDFVPSINNEIITNNWRSLRKPINPETEPIETPKKDFIDIWWLYDDGGMTMLLPYILSQNKKWKKCKLRIFTLTKNDQIDYVKDNLTKLLKKFRIPYSDVIVLNQQELPHDESVSKFDGLIYKWTIDSHDIFNDNSHIKITDRDLHRFKLMTNKYIRIGEMLQENSKDSTFVVMTLPIPRENFCPAPLYMSWLEMLSANMPPLLFIRGNQTNVLTFYC